MDHQYQMMNKQQTNIYHHHHQPDYTFVPIQPNPKTSTYESTCCTNTNNNTSLNINNNHNQCSNNNNTFESNHVNNNNIPSAQASFHTMHNTYFNMSSKARPMVIHTKIINSQSPQSSFNSSPSPKIPSTITINSNNTINYNADQKQQQQTIYSSDESSPTTTNNNSKENKYKRPCPSESYRNIAASLTLEEISRHYHLTRQDACTALKVSWRDLKERLNTLGVSRWPKTNAKKVTQFNTVTSHFEQLCSVIETGCTIMNSCYPTGNTPPPATPQQHPMKKKKSMRATQQHSTALVIVDNTNNANNVLPGYVKTQSPPPTGQKATKKQSPNKIAKITGTVEKNPCCLSPNNGSICSLSSPSTASNISFNMQQNSNNTAMGSPKNKTFAKGAFQSCNQGATVPNHQNHLGNTYQYSNQPRCEVQYYPTQQQAHSANCCCHNHQQQQPAAHQSLPHISTFFEKPDNSVQYSQKPPQPILPSISSFDTFLQPSPNSLKRGRTESSEDVLLNKKRII